VAMPVIPVYTPPDFFRPDLTASLFGRRIM
jgi:hypothetical protein